jgi:hypothetical protein
VITALAAAALAAIAQPDARSGLDPATLAALSGTAGSVRVLIRLDGRAETVLNLSRFEVLTPDARVVVGTEQGDLDAPRPDVRLWRGDIPGSPGSAAFVSVSPFGISGYILADGRTHIISSGPLGRAAAAVFAPGDPGAPRIESPVCGGAELAPGAPPAVTIPVVSPRSWTCRAFNIAIDCDYEFTQNLFGGNSGASQAYATTLLAAVSEIYQRDTNIAIQVPYLRTWTISNDPYTSTNNSAQLPQFREYWNANMGAVQRNFAHLLSGRNLGGGIAYLNAVCHPTYHYGVSANMNGFFPYPLVNHSSQNWDVMVVAHELGHNLGTIHTHEYTPPIDGCGNAYLNPPLTQDCSQAASGTIMSYCHICPGGMSNVNLTFGPVVSAGIRSFLDNSLPSCGAYPSLSIGQHPASASVALNAPVSFNVGVTSPGILTYQWRRNGLPLVSGGRISGATSATLSINPVIAADSGQYDAVVTSFCGQVTSNPAMLSVGCDANCDFSTSPPILNVMDFSCFLNQFASGNAAANCDGSTTPPTLNVQDFACFLNRFAAGCS